jgi:hypothetical protein
VIQDNEDAEDTEDGIKVMRFGSLGRIIAGTVAASTVLDRKASLSERSPEQQEEYRKELVSKIMKTLNQSNMNGLAKIIREKFHESCLLITPEVFEPISGRADIMIMFSLILETYPDSVWTLLNMCAAPNNADTITCTYQFKGTKLFTYPLNSLFRQIKTHIARLPQGQATDDAQLVNEVAEYCHAPSNQSSAPATPQFSHNNNSNNNHNSGLTGFTRPSLNDLPQVMKNSTSSFRTSFSSVGDNSERRSESDHNLDELNEAIHIPRRDQSLREVKSIETAVLKEGSTNYRRKMDFVFNEIDQIIRVVVINVIA